MIILKSGQYAKYLEQNDIQNFICFMDLLVQEKPHWLNLIVKNLDCDYLYINASDERGIETIRDKVVYICFKFGFL